MSLKEFYSVGEAASKCNVSKKALRFYDDSGIVIPDKVCGNNYRYYSSETLLTIPIVKYYKQMGFTLTEMRNFIYGNTYSETKRLFVKKIHELEGERQNWIIKYTSIVDWLNLIEEAQMVLDYNVCEVGVKFVEESTYYYMEQEFSSNPMEAIINIEFTNQIESMKNAITGPVIIRYPSFTDKMNGTCKSMRILQKTILDCQDHENTKLGGSMMLSCYHIGPHETIHSTYEKMIQWAQKHNYKYDTASYERYVVDYWTTRNKLAFVTEIMISVSR